VLGNHDYGDGIDPEKVTDCAANSLSDCPDGCCYSAVWQVRGAGVESGGGRDWGLSVCILWEEKVVGGGADVGGCCCSAAVSVMQTIRQGAASWVYSGPSMACAGMVHASSCYQ
jgi:hypothetical protein